MNLNTTSDDEEEEKEAPRTSCKDTWCRPTPWNFKEITLTKTHASHSLVSHNRKSVNSLVNPQDQETHAAMKANPTALDAAIGRNSEVKGVAALSWEMEKSFGGGATHQTLPLQHPASVLCGASPRVRMTLENKELWQKFLAVGTEMIITKSGRRMFPALQVRVYGLNAFDSYKMVVDIKAEDSHRYKFYTSQWSAITSSSSAASFSSSSASFSSSSAAEAYISSVKQLAPSSTAAADSHRFYIHPDSPATGKQWMKQTISFHRLKLTNNTMDTNGHIILNSMHRYQPRVHVIPVCDDKASSSSCSSIFTFTFPETTFVAVTAYQNEQVTQLKIDCNPFAKGFRSTGKAKRELHFNSQQQQQQQQQHQPQASTSNKKATNTHHHQHHMPSACAVRTLTAAPPFGETICRANQSKFSCLRLPPTRELSMQLQRSSSWNSKVDSSTLVPLPSACCPLSSNSVRADDSVFSKAASDGCSPNPQGCISFPLIVPAKAARSRSYAQEQRTFQDFWSTNYDGSTPPCSDSFCFVDMGSESLVDNNQSEVNGYQSNNFGGYYAPPSWYHFEETRTDGLSPYYRCTTPGIALSQSGGLDCPTSDVICQNSGLYNK